MATQVQLRRGTSAQNDAFTGATGELTYDTTNKRVRVHDGGTAGGFEIKTEDGSGNTLFADNEKAIFGAGSDLQIYHDGSNSYVSDNGTGNFFITTNGSGIYLRGSSNESLANFVQNDAVSLYFDNSPKLNTSSTGINVTGNITNASGDFTLDVAGDIILDADGGDIKLSDSGTVFGELTNVSGYLRIKSPVSNADIEFVGNDGGSTITALTLDMSDAGSAYFNKDLYIPNFIYHSGDTNTYIQFFADDNFQVVTGGYSRMKVVPSETSFNEDSSDIDFRVESNGNANMLFVDGGSNRVGIGTGSPTQALTINDGSITSGVTHTFLMHGVTGTGGSASYATYAFVGDPDTGMFSGIANTLRFATGGSDRMRIDSSGRLLKGLTSSNSEGESLQSYANGTAPASFARQTDGGIVNFRTGSVDGAIHGSVSISGVTTSYNAFSGSHWSRLSDNSKPTILKGTIIETIDEMCDWYRAEFTVPATGVEDEYVRSESIALPSGKSVGDTITHTYEGTDYTATITQEGDEKHVKCKISDTADSTRVYGVFSAWDNDDDAVNDMYVTAVGTHVVRVNSTATVSAGDLLVSNGDGTAKVQDDDIIRSKTIGKVLTNIVQETYDDGSYTVPCALYCG
jgi:hypothetical protein